MSAMQCPDCGGHLSPERDEDTGELTGFGCDSCFNFFDDVEIDEDEDNGQFGVGA